MWLVHRAHAATVAVTVPGLHLHLWSWSHSAFSPQSLCWQQWPSPAIEQGSGQAEPVRCGLTGRGQRAGKSLGQGARDCRDLGGLGSVDGKAALQPVLHPHAVRASPVHAACMVYNEGKQVAGTQGQVRVGGKPKDRCMAKHVWYHQGFCYAACVSICLDASHVVCAGHRAGDYLACTCMRGQHTTQMARSPRSCSSSRRLQGAAQGTKRLGGAHRYPCRPAHVAYPNLCSPAAAHRVLCTVQVACAL